MLRAHRLVLSALLAAGLADAQPQAPEDADRLLEKARRAAESFAQSLPNYICQQWTTRFVSTARITTWRKQDVVSAEVIYLNGHELYRNLAIDGKPVPQQIEQLSGAWSKGEFGTMLLDLFARETAARFHFRKNSRFAGMPAAVYDFQVRSENSHWGVGAGPEIIYPAYKGLVWIDRENGRTLRIERKTLDMPARFPVGNVETAADYQFVRIGGAQKFLLPARSETLICERGTTNCSRNTIDFRNYKKYSTEASINFDP
jgi:hypothetical protein